MIKLRGSNCDVAEITDKKLVKSFLEENHEQKYAFYRKAYGLYYKDELVQLMSFGKPRFNKNYEWELIRDCTKRGYQVHGGVSKLWKFFVENNDVNSCICYSYPHDENHLYTNKYVDYCGFVNIKKSSIANKIYFEGIWQGETKRIDKSILERHGVDRLLGTDFGKDSGSNEQLLYSLGFERKTEQGYDPQIDSYFPFGVLYKITDLDTGKFYIGETTVKEKWEEGYCGSGAKWLEYYEEYKDKHSFKREIIGENYRTPLELYRAEIEEIRKYCVKHAGGWVVDKSTGCMNRKTCIQPEAPTCPECGGMGGHHYKTCSLFEQQTACPECGSLTTHKPTCSHYKEVSACPECGKKYGHKKSCSQYKAPDGCPECGLTYGHHKPTCSHYVKRQPCPHCGSYTTHKKDCPNYKKPEDLCPECGGYKNRHKTTCSHYDRSNICPECGGTYKHKKTCSHYKTVVCPECGGKNNRHYKTCSKYKKPKGCCPHCGTPAGGKHKRTCPDFVPMKKCEECGNSTTRHKPTCSQYKAKPACPECGSIGPRHKKTCSLYK